MLKSIRSCRNCAHWWSNKFSQDELLKEISTQDDNTKSTCSIDGAVEYANHLCGFWTRRITRGLSKRCLPR